MSLAFALFGAPKYPTEEASDDSWDAPLAQYNTDQPAHDNHDRHGTRLADTPTWRAKMGSNYPDDPPHKRLRLEVTLPPPKTVFSPLVPTQPSSPPPAHILSAGMYANSKLALIPAPAVPEGPTRAENILRWISYAIRFGFHALGIEVVNGWAHLHELAKQLLQCARTSPVSLLGPSVTSFSLMCLAAGCSLEVACARFHVPLGARIPLPP